MIKFNEIAVKTIYVTVISLTSALLMFFVNILISRLYGANAYGEYTFIFSVLTIASVLSTLGTNQYILLNAPKLREKKIDILINKVSITIIPANILVSVLLALYFKEQYKWILISLIICTYFLSTISLNRQAIYFAKQKIILVQIYDKLIRVIIFITLLYVFFQIDNIEPISKIIISLFISYFLSSLYFIRKNERLGFTFKKFQQLNKYEIKLSLSLLGIVVGSTLMTNIDVLYLGAFQNEFDVALYGAAQKIAIAGQLFLISMTNVLIPTLVKKNNRNESMNKEYKISSRVGTLVILCFFIIICFIGKHILALFGDVFINSYSVLLIIIISTLLSACFGQTLTLMKVKNETKLATIYLLLSLSLKILLMPLMFNLYGINGIAITTVLSILVWNVLCAITLNTKYKINTSII